MGLIKEIQNQGSRYKKHVHSRTKIDQINGQIERN